MISGSTTRNFASIMVCIGPSSATENSVVLAASLASRFGSRLIGIAAEEATLPYLEDGLGAARPILVENARNAAMDNLARAETNFRRGAGHLPNIEWRCNAQEPTWFITSQARAADLVIIPKSASDTSRRLMAIDPGDAVLRFGRPVLVVPHDSREIPARSIIVAWKDTREARRAVLDALPFLQRAETVIVLSVGEDARAEDTEDVCAHLARHDVSSRYLVRSSLAGSCANAILDVALEEGSDLIVSGAYGHHRMREWVFGGVTEDLLANSPVPCLMSH